MTLDLPACLSGQVINALKADARSVHLRPWAPHFYDLGSRILDLFEDEELMAVLGETLKVRAKEIADQALNYNSVGEVSEFTANLDERERRRRSPYDLVNLADLTSICLCSRKHQGCQ